MSNLEKIAIILVNYNGKEYNEECIKSIFESSYKNLEVIVVDNDSKDGSPELLREQFGDKINLIMAEENLGFSGANNIGIKKALEDGCDYVVLLNNDTLIDKDLIYNMLNASKEENDAVISPKIYYYDNKDIIWSAGADMRWKKGVTDQRGINQKDNGSYNKREEVEFGTGCCLFIPSKVIKEVGYLTDDYFLYYEDTDYCMRVRERGFKIVYEPTAILYHKESASTGGNLSKLYIYYNTRNRLIFNKRFNSKNKMSYMPYFYVSRLVKCALWAIKGRSDLVRITFSAINDYRKNINGFKDLNK